MVVARVKESVQALDWKDVGLRLRAGALVFVCRATPAEWVEFARSESESDQNQHENALCFEFVNGAIYIVELASREREVCSRFLDEAIQTATDCGNETRYLSARGSSFRGPLPRIRSDLSFGPSIFMRNHRTRLPRGICSWSDFHTLRIDIAVLQSWPQLDAKAAKWAVTHGVEYVLSIKVDEGLHTGSFKLHSVTQGLECTLPKTAPIAITPNGEKARSLVLDSRRLLGVPEGVRLPQGFPDPEFAIDLFQVLVLARETLVNRPVEIQE